MNLWEQARRLHDRIPVPQALESRVQSAFSQAQYAEAGAGCGAVRRRSWARAITYVTAGVCTMFVLLLNVSAPFASALQDVPVLGDVARVFTFRSYEEQTDAYALKVNIPAIDNSGNSALEDRINLEIRQKIQDVVQQSEQRAQAYQQAYLATGGDPDEMFRMEIDVDYTIKCSSGSILSFVITSSESQGYYFSEQFTYNIDLQTGKDITLAQLFGPQYKDIINQSIYEQIAERMQENQDYHYFIGPDDAGFQGIADDQSFYINDRQNVVIVFEKYAIAPGFMGIQEFEIPTPHPISF